MINFWFFVIKLFIFFFRHKCLGFLHFTSSILHRLHLGHAMSATSARSNCTQRRASCGITTSSTKASIAIGARFAAAVSPPKPAWTTTCGIIRERGCHVSTAGRNSFPTRVSWNMWWSARLRRLRPKLTLYNLLPLTTRRVLRKRNGFATRKHHVL